MTQVIEITEYLIHSRPAALAIGLPDPGGARLQEIVMTYPGTVEQRVG